MFFTDYIMDAISKSMEPKLTDHMNMENPIISDEVIFLKFCVIRPGELITEFQKYQKDQSLNVINFHQLSIYRLTLRV